MFETTSFDYQCCKQKGQVSILQPDYVQTVRKDSVLKELFVYVQQYLEPSRRTVTLQGSPLTQSLSKDSGESMNGEDHLLQLTFKMLKGPQCCLPKLAVSQDQNI